MKIHFGNNFFIKLKIHSSAWDMSFFFAYTEEKHLLSILCFYFSGKGYRD